MLSRAPVTATGRPDSVPCSSTSRSCVAGGGVGRGGRGDGDGDGGGGEGEGEEERLSSSSR